MFSVNIETAGCQTNGQMPIAFSRAAAAASSTPTDRIPIYRLTPVYAALQLLHIHLHHAAGLWAARSAL